jgi:hypothetical protein
MKRPLGHLNVHGRIILKRVSKKSVICHSLYMPSGGNHHGERRKEDQR